MAIPKWLQIDHDQVFSLGAFIVSEVTPMIDFDKSSGENRVQARDRDTGLPMWQVEVLDGDPAAPKRSRTVTGVGGILDSDQDRNGVATS